MIVDVLIIGAGPAGLAAALQLQRYRLVLCLFERSRPGGLLWNANLVENYPGFSGGIPGPELARAIANQLGEAKVTRETVSELSWDGNLFQAKTQAGNYQAKAAVIASGTRPHLLTGFGIPEEIQGRVFYEVVDLLEVSGKRIVIVGSGDAAFDYACNMARNNSVIILNCGERVKCLPLLWDKTQAHPNIQYRSGTVITRLAGRPEGGMTVECSSPHGQTDFQADYLVGAIGREPQLDFLSASVLERSADLQKMGILHFVGDVKNGIFRQTSIAIGDGVRAAMRIHQAVKENAHEGDCLDG